MFNQRRWSNDHRDSFTEYQSSDANGITVSDVLNDSTDISSLFDSLNMKKTKKSKVASPNLQNKSEEHSACTSSTSNCSKSPDDLINFSSIQDTNISKETSDSLAVAQDIMNKSMIQDEQSSLNERLVECTTLSSDTETIKLSSSDSSVQSIVKSSKDSLQSGNLLNLNERITENATLSSDSGTIKLSSCNSSSQNMTSSNINEDRLNEGLTEVHSEDKVAFQYFSSPGECLKNNEEIWDVLLSLEQALSPFDEKNEQNKSQEPPHILNRLSHKFKETPTRFTEKLVSLLEESVISESPAKPHPGDNSGISLDRMTGEFRKLCKFIEDESMPDLAPSLMNMTTANQTGTPHSENIEIKGNVETPKNMIRLTQETPTKTCTPTAFKCFITPKNKFGNQTPINRFTPSADKSFEYWETVCNMMCENQGSAKKKCKTPVTIPETSKLSMDEMLTICERQMASLDDTMDVRNSEPCKNTDSELKLQVLQAPRSKSVCKIDSTPKKATKSESTKKNNNGKVDEKLEFQDDFRLLKDNNDLKCNDKNVSDVESESSEDSYRLSTRNRRSNVHQKTIDENTFAPDDFEDSYYLLSKNQRSNVHQKKNQAKEEYKFMKNVNSRSEKDKAFEDDFEMLPFSPPPQIFCEKRSTENLDNDDQDCSLLMELAKRRQRCLETAKLMLEIDREDPTSGDEDKTCLETLYKLGIQDKTFTDVEEDTKFINTLNHCFEYKNYISNKSKPIINMLQKYQSPEILKTRATSVIKSKKIVNKPKALTTNFMNQKVPATTKSHLLDPKSAIKSLQSRTVTPSKKPLLRASSTSKKKTSSGLQAKMTPRMSNNPTKITSNLQQAKSTSKLNKKLTLSELMPMKTVPRIVAKTTPKPSLQPQIQSKKTTSKLIASTNMGKTSMLEQKLTQPKKLTPKSTNSKPLLKQLTPSSDKKPLLKTVMLSPLEVSLESQESTIICNSYKDSNILCERNENLTPESQSQIRRYFVTPGKSPSVAVGRKKPTSYFGEVATTKKITPQRAYNNIESPLGLYIKGTDAQFVQNTQTRTNDLLLTPISNEGPGKSPKLKFNLASKANTSPAIHDAENIVLPTVRYQSAKKVCLTNDESPYAALHSLTPNSRTKKLLEPIENTVVIRHEGRVIDYSPKSRFLEPDMSIRAQHVAEKASTIRRRRM